jgi:hypothetical protein
LATGGNEGQGSVSQAGLLRDQLTQSAPYQGPGSGWARTIDAWIPGEKNIYGTDAQLGAAQTFDAGAKQMALEMRKSMPGAMSDADRAFLESMAPQITAGSSEGNERLLDIRERMGRRKVEEARLADEYAAQNGGRLDARFEAVLRDYANQNPLFADMGKPQQTVVQAAPDYSGAGDLPVFSDPAEAMKQPPGFVFRTDDGRVMQVPAR